MRSIVIVLALTSGVARGDVGGAWSEYGVAQPLRPSEQLVETSCDMSIELRGAVAEVYEQHRLVNPGPAALAAMTDLVLPPGAQVIGISYQRGRARPVDAVAAAQPITSQRVASGRVLGADPLFVTALTPDADGRGRFRVIAQPLEPEQEIAVAVRWTAIATIEDGAIQLALPARSAAEADACRGLVHATTGPGTTLERIRVGDADAGTRGTATFVHGVRDTTIRVVLGFSRQAPVVWTQTMPLGKGWSARAITIATPRPPASTIKRVLFVIDGSRSMELVGRHNVQKLVSAIGSTLAPQTRLEAITFDRAAARVLGTWDAASPARLATLVEQLGKRSAGNGSDVVSAFKLARTVLAEDTGSAQVILISDATLGDVTADALGNALGNSRGDLDVHAISLSPGRMGVPDLSALRALVERYGGSHVEIAAGELDAALPGIHRWLRPAWNGLASPEAGLALRDQLLGGDGIVVTQLVRGRGVKLELGGQGDKRWTAVANDARTAPIAQLALASIASPGVARTRSGSEGTAQSIDTPLDPELAADLRARFPAVDPDRGFVVLTNEGKAAENRRAMVSAGGPLTRLLELEDPPGAPLLRSTTGGRSSSASPPLGGSAVDRDTVRLLLRTQLQPTAFACYRRALGLDSALAGTVTFHLEIARGEVTRASVIGLGNATFDACVRDAAFAMTAPLPNPDYNIDDRTLVNYPLTFTVRHEEAFVVAGDADSSSPLDIDTIEGGIPGRRPIKAGNASTPLGDLKVSPTK